MSLTLSNRIDAEIQTREAALRWLGQDLVVIVFSVSTVENGSSEYSVNTQARIREGLSFRLPSVSHSWVT